MDERLNHQSTEAWKATEIKKDASPLPFKLVRPGDQLDIRTENSEYHFEAFLDVMTGKVGIRETSSHGKLSGTSGIPVFSDELKVGSQLCYGNPETDMLYRTSPVREFRWKQSLKNARQLNDLNSSDQQALADIRQALGSRKK